jgi:putative membrane protein
VAIASHTEVAVTGIPPISLALAISSALVGLGLACGYVAAVVARGRTTRGESERYWPPRRTLAFLVGVGLVPGALGLGIAGAADSIFWMRIAANLCLAMVVPVLLGLGAPISLVLGSLSGEGQRRLVDFLQGRTASVVLWPLLVVPAYYAVVAVGVLLTASRMTLSHPLDVLALHFGELLVGCLFWWPIVGLDQLRYTLSYPVRMGLVTLGVPLNALLGVALLSSHRPFAARYSLLDVHLGGVLQWGIGSLLSFVGLMVLLRQWMIYTELVAAREDERLDREAAAAAREFSSGTRGQPARTPWPPGARPVSWRGTANRADLGPLASFGGDRSHLQRARGSRAVHRRPGES